MTPPPTLDQLQRWMLAVISHPRGIEAGLQTERPGGELQVAPEDLATVVAPSAACSSAERMAVYSSAYFARLLECLSAEFPAVQRAAGEEAFAGLAVGYLQRHPPRSYTLAQLGTGFPEYLKETRPQRGAAPGPDWADLLVDLARLERTYAEVFDGPGEEAAPPLDVQSLMQMPAEDWEHLELRVTASLRWLDVQFPVHDYCAALRRGDPDQPPVPQTLRLAVYRRQFRVQVRALSQPQAALVAMLQQGLSVGAALAIVVAQHHLDPHALLTELPSWFRDWTASGLICGWSAAAAQ